MQKITLASAILALIISLIALFYDAEPNTPSDRPSMEDRFSGNEQENQVKNPGDIPNVAFIYGDSINFGYNFILDKQDELINSTKQSENKLRRSLEKAEKEYGELMEYIQSGSATEEEMAIAQQRTMELQYELQGMEQQEQELLRRKEKAMQNEIVQRLDAFLQEYAAENDIDLIINKGVSGEGVIYGSAPYDITSDVLRGLNDAYAIEKMQDKE